MSPQQIPDTSIRIRFPIDDASNGDGYEWMTLTTGETFSGETILFFAVPGAFTPACSDVHLPGHEHHYDEFRAEGVDKILCLAVNDTFVMHHWAVSQGIEKVLMMSDGNGDFTRLMGMLVDRSAHGMGLRSWRYSMLVEDGNIVRLNVEPNVRDNPQSVPLEISGAETALDYIKVARLNHGG